MSVAVASYGARHVQALLASFGRLARNPLATLLTLIVIALALALPLGLELFVTNARIASGGFANAVDLSVYLKTDVPLAKAEQLAASARARTGVAEVVVISADAALAEFRAYSGFGAALGVLTANPLPNVLHVHPKADAETAAALESLRRYFAAWPEVDLVQIDAQWVMRFNAILEVLRLLLIIAAVILGAGVIAVIGNTIRLEILNRRGEIEVTKLVGGSNGFVRRPFLYAGILYGLGGALLAWGIAAGAIAILAAPVATLARSYGSRFGLVGPTPQELGLVIAGGIVLGWLGAWISATRHLRSIEPRA
jgi:cell division transport system permease protein